MERKKLTFQAKEKQPESWDDTFKLMSWWDSEKVKDSKVMVVGAGALGNEVLKNLALMNVGNILVVDFDNIEYANLCRSVLFRESDIGKEKYKADVAADRIREINGNINVETVQGDIMLDVGLGVFRRMDVIIGCLDNRIARLFINRYAYRTGKTWVDGAIENLSGSLCVYKPQTSCYECNLTETDWKNIKQKLGCADIAQRNSSAGRVPTTPISSSIIAAMQVQEALKVIHGYEKQSMAGEQLTYDGLNNWILTYKTEPLREDCDSHYTIPESELHEAKELSSQSTVAELLDYLSQHYNSEEVSVRLNYKIITQVATRESEKVHEIIIAEPHFKEDIQKGLREIPGEDIIIEEYTSTLDRNFPDLDKKLSEIGIPPLQILTVDTEEDTFFTELTGDEGFMSFL